MKINKQVVEFLREKATAGEFDQKVFEEFEALTKTKLLTDTEVNSIVSERVNQTKSDYDSQISELSELKGKLGDKKLDEVFTELSSLRSLKEEKEKAESERVFGEKLERALGGRKLLEGYKQFIEDSEDEAVFKENVENTLNLMKTHLDGINVPTALPTGGNQPVQTSNFNILDPDSFIKNYKE